MKKIEKKCCVLMMLVLFIGLAITPSINADENKQKTFDKIIKNIVLPNGDLLTNIFHNAEKKLYKAESEDEIINIFQSIIFELNNSELLSDLTLDQTIHLIIKGYKNSLYDNKKYPTSQNENYNCLIIGRLQGAFILWKNFPLISYLYKLTYNNILFEYLLELLSATIAISYFIFPIRIDKSIIFGYSLFNNGFVHNIPSNGWISSYGVNGKLSWSGDLYGQLSTIYLPFGDCGFEGAKGFTGLKFYTLKGLFFIGYTSELKLDKKPP